MKNQVNYSIIIPVYNSTNSLNELFTRIHRIFDAQTQKAFEIIFVDDASPNPMTWQVIQDLAAKNSNITAIQLMRNSGRAATVLCGFSYARGDFIITMDDDLQHRPEDIPLLIEEQTHDVVVSSFYEKRHNWVMRGTSKIKGWFDKILLGKPDNLQITSFILMKKTVVEAILRVRAYQPIIVALIFQTTRDVVNVTVTHEERRHGRSGYGFWKRLRQFTYLLINNSTFLPRSLAMIGIILFFVTLAISIVILVRYFTHQILLPGWTSLILVSLMSNGTILLGLGILGEYLGRIFVGVEQRPAYTVRRVVTQASAIHNE